MKTLFTPIIYLLAIMAPLASAWSISFFNDPAHICYNETGTYHYSSRYNDCHRAGDDVENCIYTIDGIEYPCESKPNIAIENMAFRMNGEGFTCWLGYQDRCWTENDEYRDNECHLAPEGKPSDEAELWFNCSDDL